MCATDSDRRAKRPNRVPQIQRAIAEVAAAGGNVDAVKLSLTVLNATDNLRHACDAIEGAIQLIQVYPEAFSTLDEQRLELLSFLHEAKASLLMVSSKDLRRDLTRSPHGSIGLLHYATGRHPLWSLLMLRHPHQRTRDWFDFLLATTISQSLVLRCDFTWDTYQGYIEGSHSNTIQPFNSSLEVIERLFRKISSSTIRDPLGVLADIPPSSSLEDVLDQLEHQSRRNRYSADSQELGAEIRKYLRHKPGDRLSLPPLRGGRRRHGSPHIGTYRFGQFEATRDDEVPAYLLQMISEAITKAAIALDLHPKELVGDPVLLANLEARATLPGEARRESLRHILAQLSRSQQMMPARLSGLKGWRISHLTRLILGVDGTPSDRFLLIASLATGRPLDSIPEIHITHDADVSDVKATIELDIVRCVWRLQINQPGLKNADSQKGALIAGDIAELPDLYGACRAASGLLDESGPIHERTILSLTPTRRLGALRLLKEISTGDVSPAYLSKILPMALLEATGDLATGALIGNWLPIDCDVVLHYLTVERMAVVRHYMRATLHLQGRYGLPMHGIPVRPVFSPGAVGMHNCPSDETIREAIAGLISQLQAQVPRTRSERIQYINSYSLYSLLMMTQALGYRNRVDPEPNVYDLPASAGDMGLAVFGDKLSTPAHYRVMYCPAIVKHQLHNWDRVRASAIAEFSPGSSSDAYGVFILIGDDGRIRPMQPKDIPELLGEAFAFLPNALRRRARSKLYEYEGQYVARLGRGYAVWMGHWTYATTPHRPLSDGMRRMLREITKEIIEPLLHQDGWQVVEPLL